MIKNILVSATGGPADPAVFEAALKVARLHGAHLAFVHARLDVTDVLVSMASGGMGVGAGGLDQVTIDRMEGDAMALQTRTQSGVQEFCKSNGVPLAAKAPQDGVSASFTAEIGALSRVVPEHARFADLVVVGGPQPGREAAREAQEAGLMQSGRPTLIVPASVPARFPGTIVIAWKDTAEATRAVMAATPLIEAASRVVVISVGEDTTEDEQDVADQLVANLAWHNPHTTSLVVATDGRGAVQTLLDEAHALDASLLVMGGFSHSRMREALFGGFTQTVLDGVDLPVLMVH